MRTWWAVSLGLLVAASCTKFSSSDGSGAGPDGGSAAADGGVDRPAPSAGSIAFEEFETSCGNWTVENATRAGSPEGYGGSAGACRVCSPAGDGSAQFGRYVDVDPVGTGELLMHFYARVPDGGADVPFKAYLVGYGPEDGGGTSNFVDENAAELTASSTYQRYELALRVEQPVETVHVSFEFPTGSCLLFDDLDLALTRK